MGDTFAWLAPVLPLLPITQPTPFPPVTPVTPLPTRHPPGARRRQAPGRGHEGTPQLSPPERGGGPETFLVDHAPPDPFRPTDSPRERACWGFPSSPDIPFLPFFPCIPFQ
eukprot:TRINITY_DN764_c0_g2_i5.p1 TRINITY_DN764_c0_g2~~TRINITY_DN764_c0_g2_i5.p1  ORF type:complete len:111 (+),score=1.14 TRINITY_DN764_c0_g2_i5:179-511(+)